MNLRYVAVVAALCSVLTAGCASATAPNPESRSDAGGDGTAFTPANHTDGCGVVTFPATGDTGTVFVTGGAMTCDEATSVVDRYLHDPGLVHAGNTWAAQFDGWDCAMPTATAAETYGYSAACRRADEEIQVRPAAGPGGAEPLSTECDATAIARELGQRLTVERCYGDWAYVSTGELGDAQSLLRVVDGSWTRYTGFPSSLCRGEAQAAGVPGPELSSFRPC